MSNIVGNEHSPNLPLPPEEFKGIIFNEDVGEFLIVQRSELLHSQGGHWEFPGGMALPNEDGLSALRRGVQEVTGLEVEPFMGSIEESEVYVNRPLAERGWRKNVSRISHFIICRIVDGDFNLSEDYQHFHWDDNANMEPDSMEGVTYSPRVSEAYYGNDFITLSRGPSTFSSEQAFIHFRKFMATVHTQQNALDGLELQSKSKESISVSEPGLANVTTVE